jgi:predicted transcriptional regulator
MKKLHFEHGAVDGQYEDAYQKMLLEGEAKMKASMEAHQIAHYRQLVAQKASLECQIEAMEENNPVIRKHLGKKVKKLTEAKENSVANAAQSKYISSINKAIQSAKSGKSKEQIERTMEKLAYGSARDLPKHDDYFSSQFMTDILKSKDKAGLVAVLQKGLAKLKNEDKK